MGKYIPVDPEKWAAMVIARRDLVRYKEMCDELDAECTRLKEHLNSVTETHRINTSMWKDEVANLRAEVERLTKAGDELERVLTSKMSSYEVGNASFQWRAAKDGKQP
jgi:hypothetical protein